MAIRFTLSVVLALGVQTFAAIALAQVGPVVIAAPASPEGWVAIATSLATVGMVYESFRRLRKDVREGTEEARNTRRDIGHIRERMVRVETKLGIGDEY
jgi:hypothetical protein